MRSDARPRVGARSLREFLMCWPNGVRVCALQLRVAPGGNMELRTLVVSNDAQYRRALARRSDRAVVATPLDMITQLEDHHEIATVVLAGNFAKSAELATFLLDFYPSVRVIDGRRDADPDTFLPLYG